MFCSKASYVGYCTPVSDYLAHALLCSQSTRYASLVTYSNQTYCRHTHALGVTSLLWQQETYQHFFSSLLISVSLKLEHRLCLILRQPDRFERTWAKREWQMTQPEIEYKAELCKKSQRITQCNYFTYNAMARPKYEHFAIFHSASTLPHIHSYLGNHVDNRAMKKTECIKINV